MLKIVQDIIKFSRAQWTCFTRQELILEESVFPWVLKLCPRCWGVSCLIIMLQLNDPSQSKGPACSYDEEWSFEQPGTACCIPLARLIPMLPLAPCESWHCWCHPPEDMMWLERGRHSVDTRCSKFRTIFTSSKSRKNREMFLYFLSQNSSY